MSLLCSGAVPGEGLDAPVAAHYGDPMREQRRLVAGALVDRSHHGVVTVTGPERLSWLHALTTQALEQLPPGVPTETVVLTPHGHVEQHADVLDDGTCTWLLVEPGAAAPLTAFLEAMRFLTRVEVRDESDRLALVTVSDERPVAGAVLARPRRGGTDVLVPRESLPQVLAAHDLAGLDAWEALRVAAGEARPGVDTDHRTLVHEVGWLAPAVALDKGCYRGQETVARVHNLGRPPRRLVLLHLDGSDHVLPDRGSAVTAGGRTVGTLTSAARHYELGPVGLALLKRSVPDEAVLVVGADVAARIDRDLSSPTEPVDLSGVRGGGRTAD
ncbi:MAG TPA: folate-binding protein [Mycobacteriales bacterium]